MWKKNIINIILSFDCFVSPFFFFYFIIINHFIFVVFFFRCSSSFVCFDSLIGETVCIAFYEMKIKRQMRIRHTTRHATSFQDQSQFEMCVLFFFFFLHILTLVELCLPAIDDILLPVFVQYKFFRFVDAKRLMIQFNFVVWVRMMAWYEIDSLKPAPRSWGTEIRPSVLWSGLENVIHLDKRQESQSPLHPNFFV